MQLTKNNMTIEVPDDQVVDLVLERLSRQVETPVKSVDLPPIGEYWQGQGGVFTGIMRDRDGGSDYILITGPQIDSGDWGDVKKQATEIEVDGHKDFRLPYRKEQALQFANVPELFEPKWYWSSEQHAGFEGTAWAQLFGSGYQGNCGKDDECLGVAVRMIAIQ